MSRAAGLFFIPSVHIFSIKLELTEAKKEAAFLFPMRNAFSERNSFSGCNRNWVYRCYFFGYFHIHRKMYGQILPEQFAI